METLLERFEAISERLEAINDSLADAIIEIREVVYGEETKDPTPKK